VEKKSEIYIYDVMKLRNVTDKCEGSIGKYMEADL